MPKRKKERNRKFPYLSDLLAALAPRVGARIILEPEWGVAGRVLYKNGIVRSFFFANDINPLASSKIANDKHFSKFFMKAEGYPVAAGQTFFEETWAKKMKSSRDGKAALRYARENGYPLIAKPNDRTQGENVFLVHDEKELRVALRDIFASSRVALLERYLPGRDYRIVVLDGRLVAAYERRPLSVTGDGTSSIGELLSKKRRQLLFSGRDIELDPNDKRIAYKLKREGYALRDVLPKDETLSLLHNANLSAGGDASDVTDSIHPGFKKMAVDLTRKMGLRASGVDLMITKGDITEKPERTDHYIIEINAAPGLANFAMLGRKQQKAVEAMYLQILKTLGKRR